MRKLSTSGFRAWVGGVWGSGLRLGDLEFRVQGLHGRSRIQCGRCAWNLWIPKLKDVPWKKNPKP